MELKRGQVVRYAKPVNAAEAECRFVVVEPRGDRVLIQLVCDLRIPPMECISVAEVAIVSETE